MRIHNSFKLNSLAGEGKAAIGAIRDAMVVARALEGQVAASTKPDTSPVTVADLAIQALIAKRLRDDFPDDPLIAEEDAGVLRAGLGDVLSRQVVEAVRRVIPDVTREQVAAWIEWGGSGSGSRFWTLDPVDGTKGFLAGRQYVIALALIVDGVVQLGVVGCPRLVLNSHDATLQIQKQGGIAIAVRGRGAWWNAAGEHACRRLEVSTCHDASTARVVQSFEPRHGDAQRYARVLQLLGIDRPLLMDSQAKHVTVAAGVSDLLMRFPPDTDFHDSIWDQAAGALLIEEAGGRVTDLAGQPLDFTTGRRLLRNEGMLASNGRLHTAALDAIHGAT